MLREVEAAVLWMDCGTKAIVEAPDRARKSAVETERFIAAVVCDVPSVQSGGQWAVQWAVVWWNACVISRLAQSGRMTC